MGKMVDALRRVQQQRQQSIASAADEQAVTPAQDASSGTPSVEPPLAPAPPAFEPEPEPAAPEPVPHVSIPQVRSATDFQPEPEPEVEPAPAPLPEPAPAPVQDRQDEPAEPTPPPYEEPAAPAAPSGALARHLVSYYDRNDEVAEHYRALRTNLLAQNPTGEPQAYVLTAAAKDEGTTTTVLNLGITVADSGEKRVLVVDADMRNGSVAKNMNVAPHPGLSDLLADEASLDAVIQPTIVENLDVIAAGRPIANTAELLGSSYARQFILALKERYDIVLLDTPAITWSDAAVAARACDGAYMVVTMGETHREKVDRAIRQIESAGGRVLGCILTKMRYYIPNALYQRT